jgi:hypothetical protein
MALKSISFCPVFSYYPHQYTCFMSKRKELMGIASGLLGSFVSRNNDFDGYWGIGMLCSHSVENGGQPIMLDLIDRTISPPNTRLQEIAANYGNLLLTHLERRAIPASRVQQCQILLKFNLTGINRNEVPQTTHGSPFFCEVNLKSVAGNVYTASRYGWCDPHDPSRESSRNGPDPPSQASSFWSKLFG